MLKKIKNNRNIENAWNMLQYLYDELRSKRFGAMDISNIETLDNLYALVITTWCASIAKEGLYKEYVTIEEEELTSPRGQIDIQQTILKQSRLRGSLICNYDELSDDIYLNQVLKGTLQYFLYGEDITDDIKVTIQKTMQAFNGVGYVDINYIRWKDMKFNNSTMRYKHLIEVCRNVYNERKMEKSVGLDDGVRMYILFKKQILKYMQQKYGETDKVEIFEQPYTMSNEQPFELALNRMQRMVAIKTDNQALILMVRYQDKKMLEDSKISRARLEELVNYLRTYKHDNNVKTAGTIIYVNTDKTKLNLNPITVNNIDDYMVGETIVDIYDQWRYITNKVDDAYKYFIDKAKNKKKIGGNRKYQ